MTYRNCGLEFVGPHRQRRSATFLKMYASRRFHSRILSIFISLSIHHANKRCPGNQLCRSGRHRPALRMCGYALLSRHWPSHSLKQNNSFRGGWYLSLSKARLSARPDKTCMQMNAAFSFTITFQSTNTLAGKLVY